MESVLWKIIGARAQGVSHREAGLPCQDNDHCQILPGGEVLVAVADGAGSASRSQEGSRLAVEQVVVELATALATQQPQDKHAWRMLILEVFRKTCAALRQYADAESCPPMLFATTLTVAILSGEQLVVGQVGDGVVVAQTASGSFTTVAYPERGEYANTSYFLTMPEPMLHFQFHLFPEPVTAFAVSTDGLLRLALALPDCEPYPRFFEPLFAFAAAAGDVQAASAELEAFLDSERVNSRTEDDKTLVLVVRPQVAAAPSVAEESQADQATIHGDAELS